MNDWFKLGLYLDYTPDTRDLPLLIAFDGLRVLKGINSKAVLGLTSYGYFPLTSHEQFVHVFLLK